ncbi:MAG: hypothetical protein ACLTA5_02200 [Anaerococcus obesiensis]
MSGIENAEVNLDEKLQKSITLEQLMKTK